MYTISIRSRRIPVTVGECARRDERDGDGRWVYRALPLVTLRYVERLICSTRVEVGLGRQVGRVGRQAGRVGR